MKRKRFTEEQIIAVLREHEASAKVADVFRKHGICDATFYNWKAKYGGMDVSDAKRLKALEEKNTKLKKLPAEQILDAAGAARASVKNGRARCKRRRRCASEVRDGPVGAVGLHDHRSGSRNDPLQFLPCAGDGVARQITGACERRRCGYRRLLILLQREGEA
jgi:putative transposase